jgi:hypothetical protein
MPRSDVATFSLAASGHFHDDFLLLLLKLDREPAWQKTV